jgi:hypothetical protein
VLRLPRVRLRLWWIMAAIAAIGLVLGAWNQVPRLRNLAATCRSRAQRHTSLEQRALGELKDQHECLAFWWTLAAGREKTAGTLGSPKPDGVESWSELASQAREQAAWHLNQIPALEEDVTYHRLMRQKWQRNVIFLWLSAEPDSPDPSKHGPS